MKRHFTPITASVHRLAALVLCTMAGLCVAGDAIMITSIDMQSGPRGLVLALNTDKPLTTAPQITKTNTDGDLRTVTLRLPGTRYNQPVRHFTGLPNPATVSDVTLSPEHDSGHTEITVKTAARLVPSMTVKSKGNRILVLISTDSCASFTWRSPLPTASVAAGRHTPAIQAGMTARPLAQAAIKTIVAATTKTSPTGAAPATGVAQSVAPLAGKPANGKTDSVTYTVYGRDPFLPYSPEESQLPSTVNLELVGLIYGETDRIALMEDNANRRKPYALHERDAVENGTVLKVNPAGVVFLLTEMGISRTVTIELKKNLNTKIN